MLLTHVALSLLTLSPQGGDPPAPAALSSVLSQSEQDRLNKAAQKWFQADADLRNADRRRRDRLRKKLERARERFFKDWDAKASKEPLKHPGDLLAIFSNVFEYPRQTGTGIVKMVSSNGQDYAVVAPRGYRSDDSYPCIVTLPTRADDKWESPKDYFADTWKDTKAHDQAVFMTPILGDGVELDPFPDMSTDQGDKQEIANLSSFFLPLREASLAYRTDRNRWVLDCGKGSSAFGLRIATHFPTRFAGLILRDPHDPGELRLEGLTGIPVLLVAGPDNKAAAEKLASTLNGLAAGRAKVLEAKGPYPYGDMKDEISEWALGVRRDLFRKKVVVAPNQDRWLKSFWVEMVKAESVYAAADAQPYLVAEADRDANRITVTARNVSMFRLLLSDALIDLDKEFTLVVNDKVLTEKRNRSLQTVKDNIELTRDPNYIFVTDYVSTVPKDTGSSGGQK